MNQMGSCGKGDAKSTSIERNQVADFDCADTLPFESQLSPSSFSGGIYYVGGDYEWQYLESTLRNDSVDDAVETQPVNLAGETQVLSIAGETQALDDIDVDEDINTQLLDVIDEVVAVDYHSEGTDGTEVLENVYELSSDYPQCRDSAQSADHKEISCEPLCGVSEKKLSEKTCAIINEQISPGSMPPRFTYLRAESLREASLSSHSMDLKQTKGETNSVMGSMAPRFTYLRVESLREAALSAHNRDLKQTKGVNNSVMGTSQSQEPLSVEDNGKPFLECSEKTREADQEYDNGKYSGEVEGFINKNKSKISSSAVRKLFSDLPAEKEACSLSSNDVNGGEGLAELSIYDDDLAGLSYVNSQEPGELSQASALDFVDRLLKDNILEFDQEANYAKNLQENTKTLSSLKGQQSLAKRANGRGKSGETGIYDWDDNREDEGGGHILPRRKEEIFEGKIPRRKSLPGVQKIEGSRPDDYKNAFHSDSRLVLHNSKVRDNTVQEASKKSRKSRRNIVNDLDEQFNIKSSRGQLKPNATVVDAQGILDVGLDTQMAAEAMEALCNCEGIDSHVAKGSLISSLTDQPNNSSTGTMREITSKNCSGQYDWNLKGDVKSDMQTSSLSKTCTKEAEEHCKKDNLMNRSKRSTFNLEDNVISSAKENSSKFHSQFIEQRKSAGASKRRKVDEFNNCSDNERGNGGTLVNKRHLQSEVCHLTPIAYRTRRSLVANQLMKPDRLSRSLGEKDGRVSSLEKRNRGIGIRASKALDPKSTLRRSDELGVDENTKLTQLEKSDSKLSAVNNGSDGHTLDCPRRSLRKLSVHDKRSEELIGSSNPSVQSEDIGLSAARTRKMGTAARIVVKSRVNCRTQLPSYCVSVKSSIDQRLKMSELNLEQTNPGDIPRCCNVDKYATLNSKGLNDTDVLLSAKRFEVTGLDEPLIEMCKSSDLSSATPAKCKTPVNDASPVCMGDDYFKETSCLVKVCRKELLRELRSLSAMGPEFTTPSKHSRRRRDMTDVRILYSHHLDEDIIKHQKKILERLGVSVATSIIDATHFIADQFMRTRNMLEAMALGKPVVTHLWIESCGQASCFIDEKNYILRDVKREKEFGFSMPVSLARASQHPLLEGRRVLVTPNTKPSKEIISSLVKAVQGQAVERIGRSALKDDKIADGLLILSCEEDYASCVPFLEKGAAVYSSELLLNGIVTQRLEYERHRLFADHVKKTRSTIWVKRDGGTFLPVTKCK